MGTIISILVPHVAASGSHGRRVVSPLALVRPGAGGWRGGRTVAHKQVLLIRVGMGAAVASCGGCVVHGISQVTHPKHPAVWPTVRSWHAVALGRRQREVGTGGRA